MTSEPRCIHECGHERDHSIHRVSNPLRHEFVYQVARLSHDRGADALFDAIVAAVESLPHESVGDKELSVIVAFPTVVIDTIYAALSVPAPTLPALDANWLDTILLRYANRPFGQKQGIECRDAILEALRDAV